MTDFRFNLLERRMIENYPIKNTEELKIEVAVEDVEAGFVFNDTLKVRNNRNGIHIAKETLEFLKTQISDNSMRGALIMSLRKFVQRNENIK